MSLTNYSHRLWHGLPIGGGGAKEFNDAKDVAKSYNSIYDADNFDITILIDPTSTADDRFDWGVDIWGNKVGGFTCLGIVVLSTPYHIKFKPELTHTRIIAHEISHWIDKEKHWPLGTIVGGHGDCIDSYYSVMGPIAETSSGIPGYLAPFDPPNAKKMEFSTYSEISVPSKQTLIPIESGKDHTIHFSEKVHSFNPLKGELQWHTNYYFIEFRDNSWPNQPQKPEFEKPSVVLWRSDTEWVWPWEDPHCRDHPEVVGGRGLNDPALYVDNIGNKKLSILYT